MKNQLKKLPITRTPTKTVAFSILGTVLDKRGKGEKRWSKWRPTVSICQQDDLPIDRLELLFQGNFQALANQVTKDILRVSPETEVRHHILDFSDPWDFETVYSALFDFSQNYSFKPESEDYLVHITTGTHVAQICLYLLTETHYLPGQLLQTSPLQSDGSKEKDAKKALGKYQVIDLDLSKYDHIASRFSQEHTEGTDYLKMGIETQNVSFNKMIEQLEKVSIRSQAPILLTGPTGAGKKKITKSIYHLKRQRGQFNGHLVVVNCATLKGDNAMSALFGHTKGAFTGAITSRPGLLKEADGGILFLDEIGELGLDEQAMLLRAIEEKTFLPMGSDKESGSDFQLIAGTNNNLLKMINEGTFREDLYARINLWTYQLPSLKERIEDFEANLNYELSRYAQKVGQRVNFNKVAKEKYLSFAHSPEGLWKANFRDLNSSLIRMATLSNGGRICKQNVDDEIERLKDNWSLTTQVIDIDQGSQSPALIISAFMDKQSIAETDYYEQIKISGIIKVCQESSSMAEAGRRLFQYSRTLKATHNDSHRVKQILSRYGLTFEEIKSHAQKVLLQAK